MESSAKKTLNKLEKKAILEQEKRKKPGECLKYIKVLIDQRLINEPIGNRIIPNFDTINVKYELNQQLVPRTLFWQRNIQQTFINNDDMVQLTDKFYDEEHLIRVMTAAELNEFVKRETLKMHIEYIEGLYPNKKITLLIHGIKDYCENMNKKNVGRLAFETALAECQIEGICSRLLETSEDIGNAIMQFTKSIAEIPYKRDRADQNAEHNFYLANDNKDCVQVKGEIGLSSLWQRHLMKIPAVSLETAESIIQKYPMPADLIDAVDSCDINGPLFLADIPIRRAGGSLTAARKIGAEISKKVFALYTNTNSNYVI